MSMTPLTSSSVFRRPSDPGPTRPKLNPADASNLSLVDHSPVVYGTRDRIPDDVYHLLSKAPKNEIHVHQGGSSSLEFLSYRLRMAVEKNQQAYEQRLAQEQNRILPNWMSRLGSYIWGSSKSSVTGIGTPGNSFNSQILDEFPVFQDDAPPKMVRFTDTAGKPLPAPTLRSAVEEAFAPDNLRNYYRFSLQSDNQKTYMDSNDLAETTARHNPHNEIVSATESAELQKRKAEGLQAYRKTSSKINPYVKNMPAFYKLANEYAKSMAFENVRYTEYRVSPSGNGIGGANGSNIEDVLSSVYSGFEDAKLHMGQRMSHLDYGLIVLFERQNRSPNEPQDAKVKRAVALAKDVVRLKQEGKYNICGVDLAGDEANNPVTEFKEAFDVINQYNDSVAKEHPEKRLGITIHAGETPESKGPSANLKGYESIERAIAIAKGKGDNTPVRIGHGLQIINSSEALRQAFEVYRQFPRDWERRINVAELRKQSPLLDTVIKNNVVLEMCPKSNLQTYGIHPGFPNEQFSVRRGDYSAEAYKRHPAVFLSRLGVKVAISSDNRTISNTDVTNEFVKLFKYGGLTYGDFKQMVMNGFEGAFIADPFKKAAVMNDVKRQFEHLEHDPESQHAIELMGGNDPIAPPSSPVDSRSRANTRTPSVANLTLSPTVLERLRLSTGQAV